MDVVQLDEVVFFFYGVYLIYDIINIFVNICIVGEIWLFFMVVGNSNFQD